MAEVLRSDTMIFGAEGAAHLRMNAYSEIARLALDQGNDGLFEEVSAQMQDLAGAFPEVHQEWLGRVVPVSEQIIQVDGILVDRTNGLPIID